MQKRPLIAASIEARASMAAASPSAWRAARRVSRWRNMTRSRATRAISSAVAFSVAHALAGTSRFAATRTRRRRSGSKEAMLRRIIRQMKRPRRVTASMA